MEIETEQEMEELDSITPVQIRKDYKQETNMIEHKRKVQEWLPVRNDKSNTE